MATVTLGYWNFRGLAQIARLLLSYTNTPFNEVIYDYQNKPAWIDNDKKNIGFDFPNLPYLIDGDFKLTESAAIFKYIIRRSNQTDLLGRDFKDEGVVDNIAGVLADVFKQVRSLLINPDWEKAKAGVFQKIQPKFQFLKTFIGERGYALGYITFIDFVLTEYSYFIEAIYPEQLANYKYWLRIRHNFEQLPGILAYYARPNAVSFPFGPTAFLAVKPVYVPVEKKQNKVKIGYWPIRGLAQVPRLLLAYVNIDFENVDYTNRDKWFKEDKINLPFNFPNIPYLIDGDYTLTESSAIPRYIINKWGNKDLLGKNVQDAAKIESFLSIYNEAAGAVRGLFFNKQYQTAKVDVIKNYSPKFQELNKFIGQKQFVLGYLTLADFIVAQNTHYIQRLFPEEYSKWEGIQRVRNTFDKLPEIVAYYSKPDAFKGRFLPQFAALSVQTE